MSNSEERRLPPYILYIKQVQISSMNYVKEKLLRLGDQHEVSLLWHHTLPENAQIIEYKANFSRLHTSENNNKHTAKPEMKKKKGQNFEHTINDKTRAIAKAGPPVPWSRPMATVRAVTVAECDDGIPPESSILFESHLLSLYLSSEWVSTTLNFTQILT